MPVGTGPYKLTAWNQGQDITLSAYDGYWGTKPSITDVKFVWRAESSVRAAMVDTGEASLAFGIAPQDATSPLDKSYLNSEATFIRMDTRLAPFNDIRVRRAANLAIDRDALIGTVFSKDVQKSSQLNVPSIVGHSPNIQPWPYDPEKAKALLAEAKADGVPVDTEIVLYGRIGLYPNSAESLEAIQAMLQDVGFNVRVQMMEVKTWLDHLLKPFDDETQANMLQSQSDNALGDSVFTIAPKFRSDGNQSTLTDAKLDALIDKAATLTGEERRKTYEQAYEYIEGELVPYINLFYMVGTVRVAANVDYTPDVQSNNEIKLRKITVH
jgi:peptide/nickel transport system substrate-binding protein